MPYAKYNVKDNAYGNLLSGIWASTTTINLESWDGARFPTGNYIATLVKYTTTGDDTTPILVSEKILVVSRSTDTLTVTRWFDWSTPTSFDAGDNIYLNVTSKVVQDIQDEVTRLESDKLNVSAFNSTLRNNLGSWKVIYTNGSWDETELTLWSNGQFLKSNWTSSAPTWESPTVDINWLTLDNDVLDSDDMLVYYDGTGNKKRNAKASTTQEGLVEMATDAEANTGTDETRYINAKQAYQNYWYGEYIYWGGQLMWRSDASVNSTNTLTKQKEIQCNFTWSILAKFNWSYTTNWWSSVSYTIYKNWVSTWQSVTLTSNNSSWVFTSTEITVTSWDLIQVYVSWSWVNHNWILSMYRIYCDVLPVNKKTVTNL